MDPSTLGCSMALLNLVRGLLRLTRERGLLRFTSGTGVDMAADAADR